MDVYDESYKDNFVMDEMDIIDMYEPNLPEVYDYDMLSGDCGYVTITEKVKKPKRKRKMRFIPPPPTSVYICDCGEPARYGRIESFYPNKCYKHKDKLDIFIEGICVCGNICNYGKADSRMRVSCYHCKTDDHIQKDIFLCGEMIGPNIICGQIANYSKRHKCLRSPEEYKCLFHAPKLWQRIVPLAKCPCGLRATHGYQFNFPLTCVDCKPADSYCVVIQL